MKLHSDSLTPKDVHDALNTAKEAGLVADDIFFVQYEQAGSHSRSHGYLIQLGTYDKTSGPTKTRHYKNSGTSGATSGYYAELVYAASYDEWGWFIAYLMAKDPEAIFGPYKGTESFNAQTNDAFVLGQHDMPEDWKPQLAPQDLAILTLMNPDHDWEQVSPALV
jgi:hypothetical protein